MVEAHEIKHYGIRRRSGRYKWGSGENPYQSEWDILYRDKILRSKGHSEKEIADHFGMTVKRLREEKSIANDRRNRVLNDAVDSMTGDGKTIQQIAKALNISPRTVSNIKSRVNKDEVDRNENIKQAIRDQLAKNPYLDVSEGIERQLGISKTKLDAIVLDMQRSEGLHAHTLYLDRLDNPEHQLRIKVLTPEPEIGKVLRNSSKVGNFEAISEDGGRNIRNIKDPVKVDTDRVKVVFDEDGGTSKDGLIELRRGVDDLDMGKSRYAQVRIQVGDDHYLKGMAVYRDDMPEGVDILFNTNKKRSVGELGSMKKVTDDPNNPFGSTISNQKGALNIVNEEGKWSQWQKTWASQFLSKQPTKLIQERLDATYELYKKDYDDINQLDNPTVRKYLLNELNGTLVSAYKDLKAKAAARSSTHVILPFDEMNPDEVYAPNYRDGERVVLLRYPHGGIFELAELTVNNKFKPARETIGTDAKDAIGIHPSVAEKLSGADFDGDAVTVIPNNNKSVRTAPALEGLKGFDPSREYRVEPVYKKVNGRDVIQNQTISDDYKEHQMGVVTNLINDMTVKGATPSELARAVRHSMVVIDAYKHNLDWKKSADDNAISALQKKYQSHINPLTGKKSRGASTLLSRKLGMEVLVDYDEVKVLNPETGRYRTQKVGGRKVALIDAFDDAIDLSSGTAVERIYGDYINRVRNLATTALDIADKTVGSTYKTGAKALYPDEVASIDAKLNKEYLRAPRERQAMLEATKNFYASLTPGMDKEDKAKLRTQVVAAARAKHNPGAKKEPLTITPKEWEAIQNGAISAKKLNDIMKYGGTKQVREYAAPRPQVQVKAPSLARAKGLLAKGYTYAQVADELGVSTTTVYNLLEDG